MQERWEKRLDASLVSVTEEEIAKFLWVEFDEGYQRNPEADPQNKPYKEKSKKERMADPERGINSPAFKKFMASQGM